MFPTMMERAYGLNHRLLSWSLCPTPQPLCSFRILRGTSGLLCNKRIGPRIAHSWSPVKRMKPCVELRGSLDALPKQSYKSCIPVCRPKTKNYHIKENLKKS